MSDRLVSAASLPPPSPSSVISILPSPSTEGPGGAPRGRSHIPEQQARRTQHTAPGTPICSPRDLHAALRMRSAPVSGLLAPVALLFLLWSSDRLTDACSCSPVHPQQAFCNADIGEAGDVSAERRGWCGAEGTERGAERMVRSAGHRAGNSAERSV